MSVPRHFVALVAFAVGAGVCAQAVGATPAPIRVGCPPNTERVGLGRPETIDQVIAVARSKVLGQITHYQGRTEKRTLTNTPVNEVVMSIGFSNLPGARELFGRARRRCAARIARYSNAVLFHDGLSVIADSVISIFVVRTERGWWVFGL